MHATPQFQPVALHKLQPRFLPMPSPYTLPLTSHRADHFIDPASNQRSAASHSAFDMPSDAQGWRAELDHEWPVGCLDQRNHGRLVQPIRCRATTHTMAPTGSHPAPAMLRPRRSLSQRHRDRPVRDLMDLPQSFAPKQPSPPPTPSPPPPPVRDEGHARSESVNTIAEGW